MIPKEAAEILAQAIEKYGHEHQCIKAIEECSEFILAMTKFLNNPNEIPQYKAKPVIDEIADVMIMMVQMSALFDPTAVNKTIEKKCLRLKERLK